MNEQQLLPYLTQEKRNIFLKMEMALLMVKLEIIRDGRVSDELYKQYVYTYSAHPLVETGGPR